MADPSPVVLDLPFTGTWSAINSPARRVPSHGTTMFGTANAIDFVAVDQHGRSASPSWRSFVWLEPPERFVGFGAPILAPARGTVVVAHDGEPDHAAVRSIPARVWYALGQPGRVRRGMTAIAGNHVVIALGPGGPYVGLVHLRHGTVAVTVGQPVGSGDVVAHCGNSGNSTEPHVHVQVTDSKDWGTAVGLPIVFRRSDGTTWLPAESEIVRG